MNFLIVIWIIVFILAMYKHDKVSVARYSRDENSVAEGGDEPGSGTKITHI